MLSQSEIEEIKKSLASCINPIFFFHDDPDGLASFLLLYRYKKEGTGFCVKAFPQITEAFASKLVNHDCCFILDIAMVDQEFIDKAKMPIVWIDHHELLERHNVHYFNPRTQGLNFSATELCWQIVKENNPEDVWIAAVGAVGDWQMPAFAAEVSRKYPDLLAENVKIAADALFTAKIGLLAKIFSFNLKGATEEVNKSIKILTRIENPYEILKQETAAGKFIYKKYERINKEYVKLLAAAVARKSKDKFFIFTYTEDRLSLTKDLANELLYKFLDKVILLGREKSGEVRCSLRSGPKINVLKALQKALVGVEGHGGGHEQACGCAVKKEDWEMFVSNLRRELS